MDNVSDKAIVIGILIFIGFLTKALFRKLNVNITHPFRFSLILWCIGMGIIYLGYNIYKEDVLSPVSNYLFVIGVIPMIIAGSVSYYAIFIERPSQKEPSRTSKTEKFVPFITEQILRKLIGNKRSRKIK
jgi:quinol-cytochrome oxidoreductase complex cytochrome b subunit